MKRQNIVSDDDIIIWGNLLASLTWKVTNEKRVLIYFYIGSKYINKRFMKVLYINYSRRRTLKPIQYISESPRMLWTSHILKSTAVAPPSHCLWTWLGLLQLTLLWYLTSYTHYICSFITRWLNYYTRFYYIYPVFYKIGFFCL